MSSENPVLSASSKEARIKSDLAKIKSLEDELSRLNILENPQEIKNICISIIDIKKDLEKETSEKGRHGKKA